MQEFEWCWGLGPNPTLQEIFGGIIVRLIIINKKRVIDGDPINFINKINYFSFSICNEYFLTRFKCRIRKLSNNTGH